MTSHESQFAENVLIILKKTLVCRTYSTLLWFVESFLPFFKDQIS